METSANGCKSWAKFDNSRNRLGVCRQPKAEGCWKLAEDSLFCGYILNEFEFCFCVSFITSTTMVRMNYRKFLTGLGRARA